MSSSITSCLIVTIIAINCFSSSDAAPSGHKKLYKELNSFTGTASSSAKEGIMRNIIYATEKNVFSYVFFGRAPETLLRLNDYSSVDNITAIAMHVGRNFVFIADTSGTIRRLSLSGVRPTKSILKGKSGQSNITRITQVSVDWLNDHLYIISESRISRCDLNGENLEHLVDGFADDKAKSHMPSNVLVDPINGYLFWSLAGEEKGGIYRQDLKKFTGQVQHYQSIPILIRDSGISAFTVDYEQNRILYPHIGREGSVVISAVSEDGKTHKDFRDEAKVTSPLFGNFKGIIFIEPNFYWTDGQKFFREEYDAKGDKYYHNEFSLPYVGGDVVGIVVFESLLQPSATPKLPVVNLTVGFSRSEARVSWSKPGPRPFQGEGAWSDWLYELSIMVKNDNETISKGLKETNTRIIDLQPNTEYVIKVRPYSEMGGELKLGPWCTPVSGTTVDASTPAPPPTPEIKFDPAKNMITWTKCNPDGEAGQCMYELQIRGADEAQWYTVYNGSRVFWFVEKQPEGKDYFVKVRSRTSYSESSFSSDGVSFHYPSPVTPLPTASNREYLVAIFTSTGVFLAAILAIFCFLGSVQKKQEESSSLEGLKRGVSDLVPLPELPSHPHRNNILYMPGFNAEDLAMVPHVSSDQVELIRELGSGAFGTVYEGYVHKLWGANSAKTKVAIKTLKEDAKEQEKIDFLKEAKLMGNFNHPHILRLLAVCLDNSPHSLILELMEGGDLLKYLRCNRPSQSTPSSLTMGDLLNICIDVAKGCKYLEDMHFVHRDLAARNCLVSSHERINRVVKIGDFGLTRDIYKSDYYRKGGEGLMPVRWMSPESLVDGVFTSNSDVWSFGVLLWEVMTLGQRPYQGHDNSHVVLYVKSGRILCKPEGCPEEMYTLMKLCMNFEAEKRPSFAMCLQRLEQLAAQSRLSQPPITCVHNQGYSKNYLLTRKSASSGMTITCLTPDSLSTDEGIETAMSCCDSHETPLMSAFMRKMENADSAGRSEVSSGYDVPVPAILRSKRRPPIVGGGGVCGQAAAGEGQEVLMMGGQSVDEVTGRDCSPPPTYSQLFCTSSSGSGSRSMTISTSTSSPCSSTCDPVTPTCTHNQLHVAKEQDEISGDREDDGGVEDEAEEDTNSDGEPAVAADGEKRTGHYVNESSASLELLRKNIGAPAPSRSLCLLSRVNETFPKNSSHSLPELEGNGRKKLANDHLVTGCDGKNYDDADLLIQDHSFKDENDDDSHEVVRKGETGMHFYVNGYKIPSVTTAGCGGGIKNLL